MSPVSKSTSISKPKPKFTKTTIILYCIITLIIIIAAIFIGTAMDYAVDSEGKIKIENMQKGFNIVTAHPKVMFSALKRTNSHSLKMIFLGVASMGIFVLYKLSEDKKRLHRRGVEYGSAKWGDDKEIKSLADTAKPELKPLKDTDGKPAFDKDGNFISATIDNNMILSKEVSLSLNAKQHLLNLNALIIGGAGSGKTRFFAKPNIMQLNTSYIVTDPKGEILRSTGKMLEGAGYKLKVFNLIEMQHSNNYNPFEYCYDYNGNLSEDSVKKMVNVLFTNTKGDGEKDDFWSQKGQSLIEAIVFLLFEESEYNGKFDENGILIPESRDKSYLNFFAVTEKMRRLKYPPRGSQLPDGFFLEKGVEEDEEAFRSRQKKAFLCPLDKDFIELEKRKGNALALRLYKEIRLAPEETGESFLSSANIKTFFFNLTNLQNLTCCDTINLETIGDEKTALFIIISATNSTYNFLAAMMYSQMFDLLSNRANFKYGGVLPVPVRCIMDEFYNIGQIPDFEKIIAYVRSMGISINVIVQNLAQLKSRYEKTWEVITGNCDSFLFLGGKEESTLKYISEALGKETIDVKGQNRTKGGKSSSTSENNSLLGRELMLPSEISVMSRSNCILMVSSHNPFYCEKYPIESHPNYKFIEDYDKNNAFHISDIHTVKLSECEKKSNKHDQHISLGKKHEESMEVTFRNEVTEINYQSFEEILEDNDLNISDMSESFADMVKFDSVSDIESFDFGEPVKEKIKEVKEYDEEQEQFTVDISSDNDYVHFAKINEALVIDDISADEIEEIIIPVHETFADEILVDESEYSFDIYDM